MTWHESSLAKMGLALRPGRKPPSDEAGALVSHQRSTLRWVVPRDPPVRDRTADGTIRCAVQGCHPHRSSDLAPGLEQPLPRAAAVSRGQLRPLRLAAVVPGVVLHRRLMAMLPLPALTWAPSQPVPRS